MPYVKTPRKLAASPNFALCHAADGSPFALGEVEPYAQFWLNERERMLLALFGRKGGLMVERAITALLAMRPASNTAAERRRIERAIAEMIAAGVLHEPADELSRYGKEMARDYLEHRPFPTAIAASIAAQSGLGEQSRALDLASGPGSLALTLAERTPHVTIMELSRGFVATATEEAARRGLVLEAINESCNRLAQHDGTYDLVTISQALHWLDDIAVCKGVCRVLAEGGSFVVIHAAMNLPQDHPLSWILGDRTPLGDKAQVPFVQSARALFRRLSLLFAALDAPQVERHDPQHARAGRAPIVGAGIALYHQPRPMGTGFARAFLSDSHLATTGLNPQQVWKRIEAKCGVASEEALQASMDWAVLHFQRGATSFDIESWEPETPQVIAYP
ncbi:class I SAM-dependent methyltransferase [Novosphingobium sp. ERN07]|uniref:class I SAM-dependent methyltransferase n=1 Tax=Novosphingobium sp. ERN07 TaxID=2726187 RepID=UPI001456CD9F|nr:class I SAM-dependent methyltransferase [Novosphingobium sp. ERN07]NLR70033.1 class I SAM-dependent methyltransferase [Novosphingobium sp. ERN07]